MTNLPKETCLKLKEARQAKGLSQSTLAQMVGCKQSAVSMFEGGDTTKISEDTVKKLADILGVSLEATVSKDVQSIGESLKAGSRQITHGYCPNCECPSNVPYVVGGRLLYRPSRDLASPTGGRRCVQCGEVLETRCPSCGATLNDGACCATCGAPYVTAVLPDGTDVTSYAVARRVEIAQLRSLA